MSVRIKRILPCVRPSVSGDPCTGHKVADMTWTSVWDHGGLKGESDEQKTSQHSVVHPSLSLTSTEVPAMVRSRRARGRFGTVFIVQHHTRGTDCMSQTRTRREDSSYMAGIGLEACWVLKCAQRRFLGPKNHYGSITTNYRPSGMKSKKRRGTTWPIPSSSLCAMLPLTLYLPCI